MIRVGIIGIGFMGMTHYRAYQQVEGVEVVALCEQDQKRLDGDWTEIKGNFGEPGGMMDLSGIKKFTEVDAMLTDPEIDLIDVCLPPALHADVTIAALKAGKNVFCEKPIALTPGDAQRMLDAARQYDRQLMIGHVLPFFPEYAFAWKTICSGEYGKLLGGHFKRVISDPLWLKDFYDPQRVGGPMLDLHVHDAHYIRLLFGAPTSVTSVGRMRGEVAEYFSSQFGFDSGQVVTATSGVVMQQGRAFTHAYEIHLEKATLMFDFAVIGGEGKMLLPVTVLKEDGEVLTPDLGDGDPVNAFIAEIKEVVSSLQSGTPSAILDGALAVDALKLCGSQTESIKSGGKPIAI